MAKVTGIGGIFFKTKNPDKIKDWYQNNLGINTDKYGSSFEWKESDSGKKGFTQWSPMDAETKYFEPSAKQFMINYRVDNLVEMKKELEEKGVKILDEIQEYDYGKFLHILDEDGNNIELWEPKDDEYDKIVEARTK